MIYRSNYIYILALIGFVFTSCDAGKDDPGTEYAPNMYHAVSYEPLTQITEKDAGAWVASDDDDLGEYYNSNPNNPHGMTMREPAKNTVRRTGNGMLPYRIPKDSVELASKLENPFPSSDEIISEGKVLYNKFCVHCHGENGQGSMDETAMVGQVYKGVPAYNQGATAELSQGHIFHVITWGIRRMRPHGSQMEQEERWKIARYVETLQNK